jgi:hypothetical protein
MASCSAGGMTWSAVPTMAQDGMVFHAGTPEGSDPAPTAKGRWVAASSAAWAAGTPSAKHRAKPA